MFSRVLFRVVSAMLFIGILCPGVHAQKKKKKGGGDSSSECTAKVNKESHVWVIVTVNPKGKVTGAQIAKSSGDDCMDQKGLQMARQQSYPAAPKRQPGEGIDSRSEKDMERKFNVDMKVKPEDLQKPAETAPAGDGAKTDPPAGKVPDASDQ